MSLVSAGSVHHLCDFVLMTISAKSKINDHLSKKKHAQ